jgi:hypothetical protein
MEILLVMENLPGNWAHATQPFKKKQSENKKTRSVMLQKERKAFQPPFQ